MPEATPDPLEAAAASLRARIAGPPRVLGADVVGMSVVLEAAALRREGVRVAAVAVIANVAGGTGAGAGVSHGEVLAAGARAAGELGRLLAGCVARIPL
jgi:purine-nucleoside phosphorylase